MAPKSIGRRAGGHRHLAGHLRPRPWHAIAPRTAMPPKAQNPVAVMISPPFQNNTFFESAHMTTSPTCSTHWA
jgi:hypothetical protein